MSNNTRLCFRDALYRLATNGKQSIIQCRNSDEHSSEKHFTTSILDSSRYTNLSVTTTQYILLSIKKKSNILSTFHVSRSAEKHASSESQNKAFDITIADLMSNKANQLSPTTQFHCHTLLSGEISTVKCQHICSICTSQD